MKYVYISYRGEIGELYKSDGYIWVSPGNTPQEISAAPLSFFNTKSRINKDSYSGTQLMAQPALDGDDLTSFISQLIQRNDLKENHTARFGDDHYFYVNSEDNS